MLNDLVRREISTLLAEILAATKELRARGIDPRQREDRESLEIVKRIVERAYTV